MTKLQKNALGAFLIYIMVLVWVILLKCNMEWPIYVSRLSMGSMTIAERAEWSFCHFRFNGDGPISSRDAIEDIIVNVVLFLAIGMTLPMALGKRKGLTPIFAFLISLGFEITEFFDTIGGFAYIDLITNTLGAIIGMMILHLLLKVIKTDSACKILGAAQIAFAIITVYGIINTIIHIDIYL